MDHKPKQVIRARLKEKGWDQSELARQLGLSSTTVSRVLSGPMLRSGSQWPAVLNALGLELVIQPRRAEGDDPALATNGDPDDTAHEGGA